MQDRVKHGTAVRGSRNAKSKISEDDAISIFMSSEKTQVLAQRYSMLARSIAKIRDGTRWGWLTQNLTKESTKT